MMIEVGMHTGKHRIKLTLSSEDVETHSFMSDNEDEMKHLASHLSIVGRLCLDNRRYNKNEEENLKAHAAKTGKRKEAKTKRGSSKRKLVS